MYQDRFGKLQEHLRQLALLFRKLRLLYERCVEMTADLQEGPAEVGETSFMIHQHAFVTWSLRIVHRERLYMLSMYIFSDRALCWRRAGQCQSGAL